MKDQYNHRTHLRVGLLAVEPIRRTGLRSILEEIRGITLVESDLEGLLAAEPLGLVLVSLMMPKDTLPVIERLKVDSPATRIVIMCPDYDEESVIAAIFAGARGYLQDTASPEEVWQAVEVVASGSIWAPRRLLSILVERMLSGGVQSVRSARPQFTQRELEVLQLLISARSNREIAQALGIEVRTVKSYVGRMMRKVGVGNRIALSIHAATHAIGTSNQDN